ncbi:hypothetical protein BH23DEI1_BH23DEI1_23290 [soil metagenome]
MTPRQPVRHHGDDTPFVSIVLPIRNEERHIEACITRLLAQDYPVDRMEIIVVDGGSDDDTRPVLARLQERHPDADIRLLDNPERTVPPALNIGIRAAKGDLIVRMDGHTVPDADYVSACVRASRHSGAASVGGVMEAVGDSPFGTAVAIVVQHRVGAGDAAYRVGGEAGFVDTVPFGAFRRPVFERVGLFDESMIRNQDYEMNVRIRNAGEKIYFDPAIRFTYTPRGSVRALARQYFEYGWWRVETLRRHPASLRWRQTLPPVFVATLVVLLLLVPWSAYAAALLALLLLAYAAVLIAVARREAHRGARLLDLVGAFATVHFAWGSGFLVSLLSRGRYPYRARPPKVPPYDPGSAATAR